MQKLVAGIHNFQENAFSQDQELFETLVEGQHPRALFITCSDSRVDPNRLTQTKPGELFIQRLAGNIVPAYGEPFGGEAATIEYAVSSLKVKNIVICGHSHCGAMAGLLNLDALNELPAVKSYLQHADETRQIMEEKHSDLTDPLARLMRTVEVNVLVQLDNLKTHPTVAAAVKNGELDLYGWVYKFETGEVLNYDPAESEFLPLGVVATPHDELN